MSTTTQQGMQRSTPDPLAERHLEDLAGVVIKTPHQLAARVREMQKVAHILSPAIATSSISADYVVNTAVVVIDTTLPRVEYGSAAGGDVYYQSSIHKGKSQGQGDERTTTPEEVSLNKNALIKILGAAGVDITRSVRTDDKSAAYLWGWTSDGEIIDFDGRRRKLPPGDVEIDYRDGSAQIGEWTPQEWAKRVAAADERKKNTPAKDQWKVKPEPINGFSEDRVRNARRFGLRIAQAESLNRLIRNLGIKQKYTIEELQKPFVIFRVSYEPDQSDPEVRRVVTAARMGATHLLYGQGGGSSAPSAPGTAAGNVIDLRSDHDEEEHTHQAKASPSGADDIDDIPEAKPAATETTLPVYHLAKVQLVSRDGDEDRFFFTTDEGPTFLVQDRDLAKALNEARKNKTPLAIDAGTILFEEQKYLEVITQKPAPAADTRKL